MVSGRVLLTEVLLDRDDTGVLGDVVVGVTVAICESAGLRIRL